MPEWLRVYLSGVLMGAADIVPGVSGGTIAFIVGIYDRLIGALSQVNGEALKLLRQRNLKGVWQHFDGTFLLVLVLGIGSSIFTLAGVMSELLANSPILLWSFFFGLILASAYILLKMIPQKHSTTWLLMLLGGVVGAVLSLLVPTQVTVNTPMVFFSGVIAICAMILPGISGSFILLMLGMYGYVITAIKTLDLFTIAVFAAGAVVGLLSFAKVLNYLLHQHRSHTLALLTGIMLGALVKVWPWKMTLETIQVGDKTIPAVEARMLPWQLPEFQMIGDLLIPLVLMLLGAGLVILLEKVSSRK